MKKPLFVSILLLVSFLLAADGFAQQQSRQGEKLRSQQQQEQGQMQEQSLASGEQFPWAQKSSDILDKKIVSRDGKELGTAKDLVIGKDGKIEYVILSTGGLLGIGGEKVSVPWDKLKGSPNVDQLVADVSQSEIQKYTEGKEKSKEGDKGRSEKTAQKGQKASFMPFAQVKSEQAKEFMDQKVIGKNGEKLGKVKDVLTSEDGKPMYVVVQGESEKLHPVPVQLVRADMEEKTLSADFDKQAFESSPGFDEAQIAQHQQWEPKVRGYYQGAQKGEESGSVQPPTGMEQSGKQQPPLGMDQGRPQQPPPAGMGQSQNQ